MSRKNNPTQTIENIISVSTRLFTEKGYDKTSMQDIVTALGMSKGAIFHHFKSKEEVFQAVLNKQSVYMEQSLKNWLNDMEGHTAKEKLIGLLQYNLEAQLLHILDTPLSEQIKSPHFIMANMQEYVNKGAPLFAEIIREGKADKSITTDFPDECAEVFLLLMNIWCDPAIFTCDKARLLRRLKFLQEVMRKIGVDIVRDDLINNYILMMEKLYTKGINHDE
jgi:TetR/AcrR family acrAB operon transcriptional repressor